MSCARVRLREKDEVIKRTFMFVYVPSVKEITYTKKYLARCHSKLSIYTVYTNKEQDSRTAGWTGKRAYAASRRTPG